MGFRRINDYSEAQSSLSTLCFQATLSMLSEHFSI